MTEPTIAFPSVYFFHLHECGDITPDEEGVELNDLVEVRAQAERAAREIMCAEVSRGRLCLSCCIKVEDEHGDAIMTVPFRELLTLTGV